MTHQQYDAWLEHRQLVASRAMEASSMIGLAGEIRPTITFEQSDVNELAAEQSRMIDMERMQLSSDHSTTEFEDRMRAFAWKLDHVKVED